MAVVVGKQKIDDNQHRYLTNLSNGKNPDGSAATAGDRSWARSQLDNSSYTPPSSDNSAYSAAINTVRSASPTTAMQPAPAVQPVAQPAFQFKSPDPFSYNPQMDPAYQSALATARQNIAQQQGDTNAALRASGQGKSSYSEQVANQIGAKEMGRVSTEVLPQLINDAYARYVDQSNRDLQVQQANYGIQRDQQSDAFNRAQLTGSYLDPRAEGYINAIIDLGRKWSEPGATPEQQAAYHAQANEYRAALQAMGVDPSLFGADKTTDERLANVGSAGVQTLASQQFAYQQARDAIADEQYKQQFDEDVKRYGLEFGLRQAMQAHQITADNAQIAISRMNAGTSRMNADLNREQFAWSKDTNNPDNIYRNLQIDQAMNPTPEYSGLNTSQVLNSIRDQFTEPVYATDAQGNIIPDEIGLPTQTGTQITSDPLKREQMFLQVVDMGLPTQDQTMQVLLGLGMTRPEIEGYIQKYGQ